MSKPKHRVTFQSTDQQVGGGGPVTLNHLRGRIAQVCGTALMIAALTAPPVIAEQAVYGEVDLTGLGRDSWPLNPTFATHNAMVCNVNGPDGFLSVRSGPGTDFNVVRSFNRLAIIEVDDAERRGRWVRAVNAYRTVSKDGITVPYKPLPVQGWVHDGYLCDFIH